MRIVDILFWPLRLGDQRGGLAQFRPMVVEIVTVLQTEKVPIDDCGAAVLFAAGPRALPFQMHQSELRVNLDRAHGMAPAKRKVGILVMAVDVAR